MEDIKTFKHCILGNAPDTALIELDKMVLGGNDALDFSALLDRYADEKVKRIIVNLSKVEMINSSGLGMLVGGLSNMKKHDIALDLTEVPEKVSALLKMTHLDSVFRSFGTVEEALESKV